MSEPIFKESVVLMAKLTLACSLGSVLLTLWLGWLGVPFWARIVLCGVWGVFCADAYKGKIAEAKIREEEDS